MEDSVEILKAKAQVFDIMEIQAQLQVRINELEKMKTAAMQQLNALRSKPPEAAPASKNKAKGQGKATSE